MDASHFWAGFAVVMGAWAVLTTYINTKCKQPSAPKWKVIAYHILVDTPALWASIGKTGILGRFNLPGLPSFTVDAPSGAKPDNAGPIKLGAMLPLLLIPALLASGCAPSAAYIGALKFETGAATISMDARDAWHKYDTGHQMDIVAGAATLADGARQLAAWRGEQSKVDAGFAAVRDAIAALSSALNAAGAAQRGDFGTALADVAAAVGRLSSLLAQYGVHLQGLPMVLNMRLLVPDLAVAMIASSGGVL